MDREAYERAAGEVATLAAMMAGSMMAWAGHDDIPARVRERCQFYATEYDAAKEKQRKAVEA